MKVVVQAKSNRAVLFGRLDNVNIKSGEVNSGVLHFRRLTVFAKDVYLGATLLLVGAAILAPILMPYGWLWCFAFATCAYSTPRRAVLQYDATVSSADINTAPLARTILSSALSAIMSNSLVGAAFAAATAAAVPQAQPGQPTVKPQAFELVTAELEGGQLLLGASTRLPGDTVFTFKLRTVRRRRRRRHDYNRVLC